MRIPRRHHFRVSGTAIDLLRTLPEGDRFQFGASASGVRTFGFGCRALVARDLAGATSSMAPKGALGADTLRSLLPRVPSVGDPAHFSGGVVGYVTYDEGELLEGLNLRPHRVDGASLVFGVYDTFAKFDPQSGEAEVTSWGWVPNGSFDAALALRRAEELESLLRGAHRGLGRQIPRPTFSAAVPRGRAPHRGSPQDLAPLERPEHSPAAPDSRWQNSTPSLPREVRAGLRLGLEESQHAAACEKILEAIRNGDVYQANLTVPIEVDCPGEPLEFFEELLSTNPNPESAYWETPEGIAISASPELLLSCHGRSVESRPIKGTAARGATPEEDARQLQALLNSPKDRAELLMITDLVRNDLGKVCEYGSVHVPHLVRAESFPGVHHLVSTIRGRMRPDCDVFDAFAALFPCGSITGTPKRRAMQLLQSLEPFSRDLYTGSMGWTGFDRSARWNVAIRSGFLRHQIFRFGAGGGIVIDSDPRLEWEELHWKAQGILRAVDRVTENAANLAREQARPQ